MVGTWSFGLNQDGDHHYHHHGCIPPTSMVRHAWRCKVSLMMGQSPPKIHSSSTPRNLEPTRFCDGDHSQCTCQGQTLYVEGGMITMLHGIGTLYRSQGMMSTELWANGYIVMSVIS